MTTFLLLCWGLTYLVTRSTIFRWVRVNTQVCSLPYEYEFAGVLVSGPEPRADDIADQLDAEGKTGLQGIAHLVVAIFWSGLDKLIYCAACSGGWIGLILALAGAYPPETALVWAPLEAMIVACGAMAFIGEFSSSPYNAERKAAKYRVLQAHSYSVAQLQALEEYESGSGWAEAEDDTERP